MITINIDKAIENAEKLKGKNSSTMVLKKSMKILTLNKENWIRKIVFILIELFFAYTMSNRIETIDLVNDIIGMFITVLLALIAIVFTGYAFFQALIGERLLVVLLSIDNIKGNLNGSNSYFAEVMVFQIACVVIDLFVEIFTIVMPSDWVMTGSDTVNEAVCTILLLVIMHCNIEGIWEMKSFIFNVYQQFNLHAYSRIKDIEEKETK